MYFVQSLTGPPLLVLVVLVLVVELVLVVLLVDVDEPPMAPLELGPLDEPWVDVEAPPLPPVPGPE